MKFAVVAVGYNRPVAMSRLLKSILAADYQGDNVDLVISLDKGAKQSELVEIAENIVWSYGEKIVRVFSERQGLRPHILQCGDLTFDKYDAVVVLEDDLIVSPGFYAYCKQMVEQYDNDKNIAGISLYKHKINPGTRRPFDPEESAFDIYFMQMAQSWGQCWTKRMWKEFKDWYANNDGEIVADYTFPQYISKWNHASWLKYFNKFIVEKNSYFIYPYKSLTTNHTDIGEHSSVTNNDFQVPLLNAPMEYKCATLEKGVKYDIFFERVDLECEYFSKFNGRILLDLTGTRSDFGNADFLVSIHSLPYKVVDKLLLRYRPIEMNVINPTIGEGIFVYDLHSNDKKPRNNSKIINAYDIRGVHHSKAIEYGVSGIIERIKRKIQKTAKKIFKF